MSSAINYHMSFFSDAVARSLTTYAHYTKGSKKGDFRLAIYSTPKPSPKTLLRSYAVAGKRDARQMAKALHATPWNF